MLLYRAAVFSIVFSDSFWQIGWYAGKCTNTEMQKFLIAFLVARKRVSLDEHAFLA